MLSPLLELYFAKSNAVSPLCGETGSGEGCWAMRGGAVTTQAPLTPAPPTLRSYPYPHPHPPPIPRPPPLSATTWRTLSLRLVSAPALMSDFAQPVCSLVTAQCSAVHMDCRDAAAASAHAVSSSLLERQRRRRERQRRGGVGE